MREVQRLGVRGTGHIDKRYNKEHTATFSLFECPICQKQYELKRFVGLKRESCVDCMGVRRTTHGMCGTKPYHVWRGMLDRCTNSNNAKYHIYGGKGVKVCEKWQTFEGWWEDNEAHYQEGLTIDRKDADGDYCPENVRWISLSRNSSETTKRRPVVQYSKEVLPGGVLKELGRWDSALQAATALNLVAAHITAVCQGNTKRKTHGGFIWQYEEDLK
jgi:hypothetical protein